MERKISIRATIILSVIIFTQFSTGVNAQVFNFDYLTYSDHLRINTEETPMGNATVILIRSTKDFDATGKTFRRTTSYKEYYLYSTLPFLIRKQLTIFVAFQLGFVIPSQGIMFYTWGTPWIWTKFRLSQNLPIELRAGIKLGKLGSFWREENEVDIGILSSISLNGTLVDGTLSYRVRSRGKPILQAFGFSGLSDKKGDEFHYKLKLSNKFTDKKTMAIFLLGYVGRNRELENESLPNSYSRKTTLGFNFDYHPSETRTIGLSFLYDVAGRYDQQMVALVFNIAERL